MPAKKTTTTVKKAATKATGPSGPNLSAGEKAWQEKFGKTHGPGTLVLGAETKPYEVISTGSLDLDYKTGVGGLVEGRLTEYWGPDGVGKTTLALMAIREAQKKYPHKKAAYIDMEHKLDKPWAVAHGVDLSRLYIFEPETAEDVADAMKDLVASGFISIVVLDSIGSMIPQAEIEKDAGDAVMAKVAKIVTRMVKIAAGMAAKTGTVVLLINQVRANLSYGADTTTGGGFALKHVTTMKMKFKRTGTTPYQVTIGSEKVIVGHEIAIYIERNGVAPAYRTAIVSIFNQATAKYGPLGIDRADEAATLGLHTKAIEQSGAWYTLPGGERVNGRDSVVAALRADPDLIEQVRAQALASISDQVVLDTEAPTDAEVEVVEGEPGQPKFRSVADVIE